MTTNSAQPTTLIPTQYEQWISLETPGALLVGENPADGAYAFHRSLSALDAYLKAFALACNDNLVRPISSRELRPIVIIGVLSLGGDWTLQSPILMHPDAKARPLSSRSAAEHTEGLNKAMETILRGNPFVRSWQWKARAERRRYEGDNGDAVVSFQIAAEVLLFEAWALLLIDEGCSASEVRDLSGLARKFAHVSVQAASWWDACGASSLSRTRLRSWRVNFHSNGWAICW